MPDVPVHVVVMGVSGCGKSTIARALHERLGWEFAEGDEYHPRANVEKMAAGPVTMNFTLDKTMEERETFNVIAETSKGRTDNVVMAGAHLDSVGTGPGIEDNGTGSATLPRAVCYAVRLGLGHHPAADRPARAGLVLDDERAADLLLDRLGEHSADDVGGAARGEGHDDADRLVGIGGGILRERLG